ncbi:MAG: hypothetical protein GWP09_02905 [Nitrospiraceae bacterium]|nr:hypothetical protein [Nitrospiraceae bacterium]
MFIRKKRIKNNEYAYLVKNRWKKKWNKGNSRQKNIKYLGRVFNFNQMMGEEQAIQKVNKGSTSEMEFGNQGSEVYSEEPKENFNNDNNMDNQENRDNKNDNYSEVLETDNGAVSADDNKSYKNTIMHMIKQSLLNMNFNRIDDKNKEIFQGFCDGKQINVDLKRLRVFSDKKRKAVIELNEGFMCDYTLRNLMKVEYFGEESNTFAYKLADLMLSAGLKPKEEDFVDIINTLVKDYEDKRNKLRIEVFGEK